MIELAEDLLYAGHGTAETHGTVWDCGLVLGVRFRMCSNSCCVCNVVRVYMCASKEFGAARLPCSGAHRGYFVGGHRMLPCPI